MAGLNNKGYSFVELLLVLMIVMTISTSALYINNRYVEKREFNLFYNQLKLDVATVQLSAMQEGKYMKIVFDTGGTRYIGRKSLYEPIFERNLPPGYQLSSRSTLNECAFSPNGTIEKFGTMVFNTPSGLKNVRVFIGKGRMSLDE